MMKPNQLVYLSLFLLSLSCTNSSPKEKQVEKEKSASTTPEKKKPEEPTKVKEQIQQKAAFAGYQIEYGYIKFDGDEFDNPGYLRILRDGKIIFKDKFEGEGPVRVKSLGNHALSGKKLVFTLNYGTEACDYSQVSRYYVINPDQKAYFLKEYYSSCGGDGYACHIFNHIFPEDSLGIPNSILFVEGFVYNEHDQEDQIDTTRISFSKDSFKIKKLTNNLEKGKY